MSETTDPVIATFSIAALDADTGELGVAVASCYLAVGAYVPLVMAGVGAVASQAATNLGWRPAALDLLRTGESPAAASAKLQAGDPDREIRQIGIVSANGESSTYTGPRCTQWAGGLNGPGFAAQGNILAGPAVVNAMVQAYLDGRGSPLPERLLRSLAAAEREGGDRRGRQAAALVVAPISGRNVDLRVDDHEAPIGELARLLELWRGLPSS